MKFANKWIVVPFNSLESNHLSQNPIQNIFKDKNLTPEQKINSYNHLKIKELAKTQKKQPSEPNDQNYYLDTKNTIPDDAPQDLIFDDPKPIKKKKKSKKISDKSFYNVPASKNTRSKRKIGNETLNEAFNNSVHKRKTKPKIVNFPDAQLSDILHQINPKSIGKINELPSTSNPNQTLAEISPIKSQYNTPMAPIKQPQFSQNKQNDSITGWLDINNYKKKNLSIMEID